MKSAPDLIRGEGALVGKKGMEQTLEFGEIAKALEGNHEKV